jgi:23S rRNA (uracil1939-C5)-methyltransferase
VALCRHFGVCGGCVSQDLDPSGYLAGKLALVVDALAREGLDTSVVAELVSVAPGTRRAARFGARNGVVGFTVGGSNELFDVMECPVLRPEIVAALPALRAMAPKGFADMPVTLSDTGLDVVLRTADEPGLARRQDWAARARAAGFARVSWQRAGRDRRHVAGPPEPIAALRPVRMGFSGVPVDLPPAAFLQPTAEGEALLVREVVAALDGAKRVADLYAGCGPFAFALHRAVHAYEGDAAMSAAVTAAANRAQRNVKAETRDLTKRPLLAQELDRFDGMVLDPPRAGAAPQARELAKSKVPTIAYVSCNPQSFARDARVLVDGGYRLMRVVPLDQFLWSPHVELAARLTRS